MPSDVRTVNPKNCDHFGNAHNENNKRCTKEINQAQHVLSALHIKTQKKKKLFLDSDCIYQSSEEYEAKYLPA